MSPDEKQDGADEIDKYPDGELDRLPRVAPRAPEFTSQNKAVAELVVLSQPKTVPDYTKLQNYVYNVNAGQGTYIYIVEEGIDVETDDLDSKVNQYIFSKTKQKSGNQDDSEDGHTTCVASKAAGKNFGVAKKAELVSVKTSISDPRDISSIFDQILSDVQKKKRQGKAVINLSWGVAPPSNGVVPQHWLIAARHLRKLMNEEDVIVVGSAGNHRQYPGRENIDRYPKIFAADDFPIINVGNTLANGNANKYSQIGPKLHVWAVGTDITCASAKRKDPNKPWSPDRKNYGTSFAAPQVAGLLAYFLSLDTVPFSTKHGTLALNARNFMRDRASYQRGGPGGIANVAWNLVTEDQNKPTS
ncbi:hypothetical protein LTR28_003706 [Elasticomyces elasticus]|nr:hypothetical protein LTR28_003706 [Elasticomyces elasticus]